MVAILLVGEPGSGKTTYIRMLKKQSVDPEQTRTLYADLYTLGMNITFDDGTNKSDMLNIWDVPGTMTTEYIAKLLDRIRIDYVMIMYDGRRKKDKNIMKKWRMKCDTLGMTYFEHFNTGNPYSPLEEMMMYHLRTDEINSIGIN
jgi:GTPase SAR1 family protein